MYLVEKKQNYDESYVIQLNLMTNIDRAITIDVGIK